MGRVKSAQKTRKKVSTALVVREPITVTLPTIFEKHPHLKDAVRDYIEASEAPNSIRARESDWKMFTSWCIHHGVLELPAEPATVAAFLADQNEKPKAVATIIRYSQSIRAVHTIRGHESPVAHAAVQRVLAGMRHKRGVQQKPKEALTAARVAIALPELNRDNQIMYLRDRVVILLGLVSAMRRSELCSIDIEDLHEVSGGFVINLKRSKTDQDGVGRSIAVHEVVPEQFCPVRAIKEWLQILGRQTGPLLCGLRKGGILRRGRISPGQVSVIVKRVTAAGGFDATKYGGHSLRAGYVTTAREHGVDWASIMEQTGHKRLETAKRYTRYTPDVFEATKVVDVFNGAFKKKED